MMLQALISYAERENLGDADFETVGVRWLIPLDRNGQLAGDPIPLAENPNDKKLRPKNMQRPFTSPNELNQGTKSHFLCDTLERATLFLDPKTPKKSEGRRTQHGYFLSLLEEATQAKPDEAIRLNAVVTFLRDSTAMVRLHAALTDAKAKPTDNTTFAVEGVNLLDLPLLKTFWRERRQKQSTARANCGQRICIATGALAETLDTTEKIKGVPGGLATGTNLISFDKDSFCSFGLEQAQNAALSVSAELSIRSALNTLISKSRSQGLVFNDTIHLHWTRKAVEHDPFDLLDTADAEAISALLKSVKDGRKYIGLEDDDKANAYYAMSLSGNGARIVVRDWLESTVPEIERNIADWFADLAIAEPDGSGVKRDFKFGALLYGMVRAGLAELPPTISTQLMIGALRGRSMPLPQAVLATAVRRQHLDQENKLNPARLAIIKACLIRSANRKETDTMKETLDPESKDRAYLCGQLFAVIGRLQLLALGKVGTSIAERTYGGVATRPATTFGPLFTKLPAYLKKANTRFPGSGTNKQKELENLSVRVESLGGIPQILGLEEQGRFALGYYCQLAQYRTDRAEAEAAKKAEELADESN
jgi:CRISPR-associated protein Csd1